MVMVVFTEDQLRAKIAEVVGRLDGRVDGRGYRAYVTEG